MSEYAKDELEAARRYYEDFSTNLDCPAAHHAKLALVGLDALERDQKRDAKTVWRVKIVSVGGYSKRDPLGYHSGKIQIIKAIRVAAGLGLKEAKVIVDLAGSERAIVVCPTELAADRLVRDCEEWGGRAQRLDGMRQVLLSVETLEALREYQRSGLDGWSECLGCVAAAATVRDLEVEGEDVMERLGITRYEPPEPISTGGEDVKSPPGFWPVYDVESWHRYRHLLYNREEVIVTEKRHGASARFVCVDGVMYVGSRTRWKDPRGSTIWARAFERYPWIESWCRTYPNAALYGEVFGQVQDLKYGSKAGEVFFEVFDVLALGDWAHRDSGMWQDVQAFGGKTVPTLYRGPYNETVVRSLADGWAAGAEHIREGCVVRPVNERSDPEIGRVQLKLVSDAYLERA